MTKLIGIINLTPDSFSKSGLIGRISEEQTFEAFLNQFEHMISAGASVIDIGAESTRPNATPLTADEEWQRLEPFIEILAAQKELLGGKLPVEISIDSYHPQTIENCAEMGIIDIANDVTGLANPQMIKIVKKYNLQAVFMHSLSVPADKNIVIPEDKDEIKILKNYAKKKLQELENAGLAKEQLIFDVGLGFGKTPQQSYNIIKNISKFKNLGVRLLVGHSEKSFLSLFTSLPAGERGLETAIFSTYLAANGVDYLRVHDVALNKRAIKLQNLLG